MLCLLDKESLVYSAPKFITVVFVLHFFRGIQSPETMKLQATASCLVDSLQGFLMSL